VAIRKRIGIMVPATNTTVEPDFHRVAPPGVTIHSQRLWLTNAGTGKEAMDEMNAQLEEGARHLAQGKVEVVNMTGTTNSFYRDLAWSDEMERIMSRGAGGIPAVATSPSVVRALSYFGARKISVATPYPDWNNERLKVYFESAGFDVLNVEGESWASRAGAQGINDQDPEVIVDFASGVCRDEADALFCPCTAWRSMEAAAELEQRLGKPVVTAVQATAWRTFRKAGITQSIAGNGRLLELMPSVDD
jgi:maleate cis-trans isomerase